MGVVSYSLDGTGGVHLLQPPPGRIDQAGAGSGGFVWINVEASTAEGQGWLDGAGLPALVHAALVADETRPRCTVHDDWALMNLRGVNLNPGADPEDMVSLRLYLSAGLVVSVHRRPMTALRDLMDELDRGRGPSTPGELVARLALRLADRAEPVVARLNERVDELEDRAEATPELGMRGELADIRRVSIVLRRYMFPQRDALSTLEIEDLDWLSQHDRSRLREATERVTRLAEELDAIRDRAQVVHDMIMDVRAEIMNRQMLLLSVVAAIFLPLGLVTGLLGVNLAGIPGAGWRYGFWALCGLLGLIFGFQLWLFRRLGLLGSSGGGRGRPGADDAQHKRPEK